MIGYPRRRELVICRIDKINPHSVDVEMIEYGKHGIIHVSEVAKRWVRDIREFLKEGQYVVCYVMDVDESRDSISVSVKRVRKEDAARKLNEFKRERKATALLEFAAKSIGKTLEDAKREVTNTLIEELGSLAKSFEIALKNPDLLEKSGISRKWIDAIIEIANKNYVEKTHELKAKLNLVCYRPDGVEVIKSVLTKNIPAHMKIQYISTPVYMLVSKGQNFKKLRVEITEKAEEIVREINKNQGEASFEILEK